jgi:hypothetical protein
MNALPSKWLSVYDDSGLKKKQRQIKALDEISQQ